MARDKLQYCVIKSFKHVGLERFFRAGIKSGIQPKHARRLTAILMALDLAARPEDMNLPAWRLHILSDDLAGHWSVRVDPRWRVTFCFEGKDAVLTDYQDYHHE